MLPWIALIALAVSAAPAAASAASSRCAYPTLPAHARSIEQFVPTGWRIESQVHGVLDEGKRPAVGCQRWQRRCIHTRRGDPYINRRGCSPGGRKGSKRSDLQCAAGASARPIAMDIDDAGLDELHDHSVQLGMLGRGNYAESGSR